ncbi:MAG: hypothetical protein LWW79_02675 [Holophagaceae bacterium]|nr:hypothetical protein [Holophagaceae bacterium]
MEQFILGNGGNGIGGQALTLAKIQSLDPRLEMAGIEKDLDPFQVCEPAFLLGDLQLPTADGIFLHHRGCGDRPQGMLDHLERLKGDQAALHHPRNHSSSKGIRGGFRLAGVVHCDDAVFVQSSQFPVRAEVPGLHPLHLGTLPPKPMDHKDRHIGTPVGQNFH